MQTFNQWKYLLAILPIICMTSLLSQYVDYMILSLNKTRHNVQLKTNEGYLIKTKGCKIPTMNAWDPSILEYIIPYKKIVICNKGKPALYESSFTSLKLKKSSLQYYNITDIKQLKCCYIEVKRRNPVNGEKDNKYTKKNTCIAVQNRTIVNKEFIFLTCKLNNRTIYKDMFWYFYGKEVTNVKKITEFKDVPINVLIIGLDGMSRLNLYRQMPKTVHLLKAIGTVDLEGFSKVGDNTFPNLFAMLTGKTEQELKQTCISKNLHYDNCTFLWNLYKNKKYVTSWGEDSYWMSTFNYGYDKGFIKQPTDYVYGYFDYIANKLIGNQAEITINNCIGPRFIYKDHLKYNENFLFRMMLDKTPYFSFSWANTLSHDTIGKPETGDNDYYQFFNKLYREHYLTNTVLIFMSDHGIRYGKIRLTYQGLMEERMPFVFVLLPEWFKKKFCQASNNLRRNSHKLTTPFDLHETMVDLLNPYELTDEHLHNRNTSHNRGISLFSDIPETRTCDAAQIKIHWCPCMKSQDVPINKTIVKTIAKFVVDNINDYFKGYNQCAKLNLTEILKAQLLSHDPSKLAKKIKFEDYMVTIRTSPGSAIFESSVRILHNSNSMSIIGTISRLNMYGRESSCVTDYHLKLYCYCTSLL